MKLFFKGAIADADSVQSVSIVPSGKGRYSVRVIPGYYPVYETSDYNAASRFVAEVQKALKQGISCGAEWIDCSGLPGSVETGIVVLRGDAE